MRRFWRLGIFLFERGSAGVRAGSGMDGKWGMGGKEDWAWKGVVYGRGRGVEENWRGIELAWKGPDVGENLYGRELDVEENWRERGPAWRRAGVEEE